MKKIFRMICALLAIATVTSCSHEELLQTETQQKPIDGKVISVKAYTPSERPATRLAFEDKGTEGLKLSWSTGDAFTAVIDNSKVEFTYNAETQKFVGEAGVEATLSESDNAYYPAYTGEQFAVDLSRQTGALNSATTYMEGVYSNGAFHFEHLTAILKVSFTGLSDAAISTIRVVGEGVDIQIEPSSGEAINKEAVYINLPAIIKDKQLTFNVTTDDDKVYTAVQTVQAPNGIEIGKFYVASIALVSACNLPSGYDFNTAVKNFLNSNSLTKIKFIANSTNTNTEYKIETSDAYMVAGSENTLEIHTAAAVFVFNKNCASMFSTLTGITSIDFGGCVNTSNVESMEGMFSVCSALASLDLSGFNTSNVTTMSSMFASCSKLSTITFGDSFDTSKVTTMWSMFFNCDELASLDLSSFNTSNVTTMEQMFHYCPELTSLDLSSFNTSNVTTMEQMFYYCSKLAPLDLSSFNTSNVTTMKQMFYNCVELTSLDLSSFDTSKVTTMMEMFYSCNNLASLDLSSFDFSEGTNFTDMFQYLGTNVSPNLMVYVKNEEDKTKLESELTGIGSNDYIKVKQAEN